MSDKTLGYLGIDGGSVSTNLAILDPIGKEVMASVYRLTQGRPVDAVQKGLKEIKAKLSGDIEILGVGTTGSARVIAGYVVGADIIKNEITAHATASRQIVPNVRTIIEIGGQDSKIIILRNGVIVDFAMNTVCAAGTGSFLDHQSQRLGIPIEEFGSYALKSGSASQIAGRCSVFAESDMIHKQQIGHQLENIIYGLCEALVRNYLNNLAKGRELESPYVFQGGVAANAGMKRAFQEELELTDEELIIPTHFDVMGAIGVALLAKGFREKKQVVTNFKGFEEASSIRYETTSSYCGGCSNNCELIKFLSNGEFLARWGSRCGKHNTEDITLRPIRIGLEDSKTTTDCAECTDTHTTNLDT